MGSPSQDGITRLANAWGLSCQPFGTGKPVLSNGLDECFGLKGSDYCWLRWDRITTLQDNSPKILNTASLSFVHGTVNVIM